MRTWSSLARTRFAARIPHHMKEEIKRLRPDHTVVDCGAHVGLATGLFAKTGASVWAFEPNPDAYEVLRKRMKKFPRVKPVQAAVTDGLHSHNELFFHQQRKSDPIAYASGSSLRADKPNVSDASITVQGLDLAKFLTELGSVQILKMDLEGYEVNLIPHLIKRQALKDVRHVWVELHAEKWPSLAGETGDMLNLVARQQGSTQFSWDWP